MRFNSLLMLGSRVRAPAGSPDNISDNQSIVGDIFVFGGFLIPVNLYKCLKLSAFCHKTPIVTYSTIEVPRANRAGLRREGGAA